MNAKVVFSDFFPFFSPLRPLRFRFQLGNSFYFFFVFFPPFFPFMYSIRFQLSNSFVKTKMETKFLFMYSFSIEQFICEY